MRLLLTAAILSSVLSSATSAEADEAIHRLTLKEVAALALARHPALATEAKRDAVAEANVDVATTEAIPKVGVVGQVNRSTGNVVPGATFAMSGIPGVQGPPGATRFGGGAWQSAAGLTASWDFVEIARVQTLVAAARSEASATRAEGDVTQLSVLGRATDAFFVLAEARALVTAAQASEKRSETFQAVVAALAGQKLRPELDLARADADLATARVALERTRLSVTAASTRLAEAIGEPSWSVDVADAEFAALPAAPSVATSVHPAIAAYEGAAKAAKARAAVAKLSYLPRAEVLGAAWLRGGGYVLGGPNHGTASGIIPDTPNWAVGFVVEWTPTDIPASLAKARAEMAQAAVDSAKTTEVSESLTAESKLSRASLTSALAVAAETVKGVTAAKREHELASTRYTTGIGNVLEVADAERALAAAERDDTIARFDAWRAVVAIYFAQGDLGPLLGSLQAKKAGG